VVSVVVVVVVVGVVVVSVVVVVVGVVVVSVVVVVVVVGVVVVGASTYVAIKSMGVSGNRHGITAKGSFLLIRLGIVIFLPSNSLSRYLCNRPF